MAFFGSGRRSRGAGGSKKDVTPGVTEGPGLQWLPSRVPVVIQNVHINSGLFYVGAISDQSSGLDEISTVDPSLRVSTAKPSSPKLSDTVPVPYHRHSWPARLTYLRWLTDRDQYVEQNFLLLYLCGLERRILPTLDGPQWRSADLPALHQETERLLRRHRHHGHFVGKAQSFLALLDHLTDQGRSHTSKGGDAAPGQRTYRSVNPHRYTVHFGKPRPVLAGEGRPATSTDTPSAVEPSTPKPPPVPSRIFSPAVPVPAPPTRSTHEQESALASSRDSGREEAVAEPPNEGTPFLDPRRLAEVQADVRNSDALLADLYADDENEVTGTHRRPLPPSADGALPHAMEEDGGDEGTEEDDVPRLPPGPAALLAVLVGSTEWPRSVASTEARRLGLMLGAALESINEYAVDTVGAPLLEEEGQKLFLDEEVLAELPLKDLRPDMGERNPPGGPRQSSGPRDVGPLPSVTERTSGTAPHFSPGPPPARSSAGKESSGSIPSRPRPEPPRWVGPDERVHVQGRDIGGGLFYLGTPAHANVEPEAVDPLLSAAGGDAARHTTLTTKVRPYVSLDPEARASHLEWLARGRSGEVGENSLFLFVVGVEKRALIDLAGRPGAEGDLLSLARGLREVAGRYPSLRRFHSRVDNLCAALERMAADSAGTEKAPTPPSPVTHAQGVSPHLLYGLGRLARQGSNVDAEWALSWSMHHPELQPALRLRTDPGFHTVFRELFARRFSHGIVLPRLESRLKWTYTPVHPRIDPVQIPTGGVADYSRYEDALRSLKVLVQDAVAKYGEKGGSASPRPPRKVSVTASAEGREEVARLGGPARHDGGHRPSSTPEEGAGRWSVWRSPGTPVRVGPYIVASGMLYTGHAPGPDMVDNVQWASAIDPGLPIERADTVEDEPLTSATTSYFELSPRQRGQYLLWLSTGRTKAAPVLFVRLFLNGLERRLVEAARSRGGDTLGLAPISRELSKLRDVFRDHPGVVADIDHLIRLHRCFRQVSLGVSENDSEHTYTHRSRCPGLGSVRLPLPRAESEKVPAEDSDLLDSATASPIPRTARERFVEPSASPETGGAQPVATRETKAEHGHVPDTEKQTLDAPSPELSSRERTARAHVLLGIQLALRSTGVGSALRSTLLHGLCHLTELEPEELSRFRLYVHERETPSSLTDLVAVLASLPLREREKAGDLLLESAEAAGDLSDRQTALLLWIHRRLGLEGVLRLRLSERGVAPARTGNADPSDPEPALEVAGPSAPPSVSGLAEPYARLLLDLGERGEWRRVEVARLACWYGLGVLDAIDTINEAAWDVGEEDVLAEGGTRVSVNSTLLKEMTR